MSVGERQEGIAGRLLVRDRVLHLEPLAELVLGPDRVVVGERDGGVADHHRDVHVTLGGAEHLLAPVHEGVGVPEEFPFADLGAVDDRLVLGVGQRGGPGVVPLHRLRLSLWGGRGDGLGRGDEGIDGGGGEHHPGSGDAGKEFPAFGHFVPSVFIRFLMRARLSLSSAAMMSAFLETSAITSCA